MYNIHNRTQNPSTFVPIVNYNNGLTVAVEKVGHQKPVKPWSPRPGDRGYDLMC